MKWVLIILGGLAALVVLIFLVGTRLPREHVASTTALIKAPPEEVWQAIARVSEYPSWRKVKRVDVLDSTAAALRWREDGGMGPMTFERLESEPPRRFAARIVDTDQGFGGTWTYEIVPEAGGSRVTITERGWVDNALFRFMARFIFGYHGTQEDFLRALGRKFGAEIEVERVVAG